VTFCGQFCDESRANGGETTPDADAHWRQTQWRPMPQM
jgi:hypothetical protein